MEAAVKTRKMTAAAKSGAPKTSAPGLGPPPAIAPPPAPAPAPAPAVMSELPVAEAGRVGGAAGRLLAAARGSGVGGNGLRRVPIDSTEAAAGLPGRRAS